MFGRNAFFAAVLVWGSILSAGSAVVANDAGSASKSVGGQSFDIPDPAKAGRIGEIYTENCAGCHDQGVDRAPQRVLFSYMSPQSIYRALKDGKMSAQASGLTDAERVELAEFLTRKKIAANEPEPPACKGKAASFDFNEPPPFPNWGLAPGNTRQVPTDVAGIDKAKVSKLKLKWAVAFPNSSQVRSQPGLAGGALYIGSHNGAVYALDRATGCKRWIFQAGSEVRTGIIPSVWKAGDKAAKPVVYFGDIFAFVYAVDAQTGQLIWRMRAEEHPNNTITGTPTLYGDTLYVTVSSLEGIRPSDPNYECCTARGAVVAVDAKTGAIKWKTHPVDTPKLVGKNAKGANHYAPAGGSVWSSPSIDVKRKQLYVGTGPNSTSPATNTSDAVVAMDLETGAIKWAYQGYAGDASNLACLSADKTSCPTENGPDYDFGGGGAVLTTTADGRDIVLAGQKSGDIHAIDPDTGKGIWRQKPGRGGIIGGVLFGVAVNKDTVFVPINDALAIMHDGQPYKEPAKPGMYAFDITTGKQLWATPSDPAGCAGLKTCTTGYSQAITATPDLVFAGTNEGLIRIFDAKSGAVLWETDAKKPVKTVNGTENTGGSFSGGAGPILYHGMMFASSGYSLAGLYPGNVLLAFEAK
jgi:polyvinyl alcohol dehydrogenase (cytochrome)